MNKSENRYQQGKIYSIRSHNDAKFYLGSTCMPLSKRFYQHKKNYDNGSGTTSKDILKYDDAYIELIEEYKCNTKDELLKREGELIRLHKNDLVNIVIPKRNQIEYLKDNKTKFDDLRNIYLEKNKDKIKKQQKIRNDRYNSKNIIKNKIKCICGSVIREDLILRHNKSLKHINYTKND